MSVNRFFKELTRLASWALREEVEVLPGENIETNQRQKRVGISV